MGLSSFAAVLCFVSVLLSRAVLMTNILLSVLVLELSSPTLCLPPPLTLSFSWSSQSRLLGLFPSPARLLRYDPNLACRQLKCFILVFCLLPPSISAVISFIRSFLVHPSVQGEPPFVLQLMLTCSPFLSPPLSSANNAGPASQLATDDLASVFRASANQPLPLHLSSAACWKALLILTPRQTPSLARPLNSLFALLFLAPELLNNQLRVPRGIVFALFYRCRNHRLLPRLWSSFPMFFIRPSHEAQRFPPSSSCSDVMSAFTLREKER